MIGPWVHGSPGTGRVGARDFTNGAAIDYPRLVLDWCDLHARGIDHGLRSEPPVRVFVMGANEWRTSPTWPLAVHGACIPAHGWPADDRCAGPRRGARHAHVRSEPPCRGPALRRGPRPRDQRAIEARPDVLTFSTPPLERGRRGHRPHRVPPVDRVVGARYRLHLPPDRRGAGRHGVEPDEPDAGGSPGELPPRRDRTQVPDAWPARGADAPPRR